MNRLFNRAKIVLNLHSEDFPDTETRVYEALGSGAFLLTEPLSAENPFSVGEDLVEATGVDGLLKAIDFYLSQPEKLQTIAKHGLGAAQNHTYAARARTILNQFRILQKTSICIPGIDTSALKKASVKEPIRRMFWSVSRFAFRVRRKTFHLLEKWNQNE